MPKPFDSYFKTMPITCHTKYIKPGGTFVAIKGVKQNGETYIPKALLLGAKKIVIQNRSIISKNILAHIKKYNATLERVANTRLALAQLSAHASDYAHKKLKLIGITGTKGKTSTSFILEHILQKAGYKTGLISTVYNKINNNTIKSSLTTEQPDYLHHFFSQCVKQNIEFVIMEIAAQALSLHRVADLQFDSIIFTNFSQEHGEFYNNLDDYFAAKYKIFEQLKTDNPIFTNSVFINNDDAWGKKILQKNPRFKSFGVTKPADISAQIIDAKKPLRIRITHNTSLKKSKTYNIHCPAIFGAFNTYNILAAFSVAQSLGISIKECVQHIQSFTGTPGRLELHKLRNGARCFIDYAHNPSSYKAVLSTLRGMSDDLILVFGAGGERDQEKRPIMGDIASKIADKIILTADNPRSEDPKQIIEDIIAGIKPSHRHKVTIELDRKIAIQKACEIADNHSVISILGKGPDEYQITGTIKSTFNEKEILKKYK